MVRELTKSSWTQINSQEFDINRTTECGYLTNAEVLPRAAKRCPPTISHATTGAAKTATSASAHSY